MPEKLPKLTATHFVLVSVRGPYSVIPDTETAQRLVDKLLDVGYADAAESAKQEDHDEDADLVTKLKFKVCDAQRP